MKVLMVSKACYLAEYRRKLVEMAALPGMDLTLIVPPYWRMGKRQALLEPRETEGYRMLVENPVLNGNFHLHFYPRLGAHLSHIRPDIMHIDEEPYDLVTFLAVRSAARRGVRTVFFTWQNLWREFPPPFGPMEKHVLRRADGAIAGNAEASSIVRRKGYSGPLATVPQFGVDPDVFCPSVTRGHGGPFTIGYAGRLVKEKGIMVLLEALAGLEGGWQLLLVGEGPLRQEITETTQRLRIASQISLLGGVASGSMPAYFAKMDVLVIPSLTIPSWKEQFGRVIVEAMACGVPVVGSDSGEIPYVIDDAGLVCPEGDASALRSALSRLMGDADLRSTLSRRGRERVLAHYTQKQVAQETVALYDQVLRG